MKRLVYSLLAVVGMISATACEGIPGMVIVDWSPVNIYITATDADGKSIISPDMPGMALTFRGETYSVMSQEDLQAKYNGSYQGTAPKTKAYLAILDGLIAEPAGDEGYRLRFGEIDGAEDMDEDIVLQWPDGSMDTIHYHCSDHREWPSIKCNRSWKLNGEAHDGNVFAFTGKSLK